MTSDNTNTIYYETFKVFPTFYHTIVKIYFILKNKTLVKLWSQCDNILCGVATSLAFIFYCIQICFQLLQTIGKVKHVSNLTFC